MECSWHPGQEADVLCLKCGRQFCRQCVMESKSSQYCPDCYKTEVARFATQLTPKEKKEKAAKEKAAAKKEKKMKKPVKQPKGPPPVREAAPPPPAQPTPPTPEKQEFWGDVEKPRKAARARDRKQPPPQRVEGFPPPPADIKPPPGIPPAGSRPPGAERVKPPQGMPKAEPRIVRETEKRRILPPDVRQKAVLTSEGFPIEPGEGVQEEEAAAPVRKKAKAKAPKRRAPRGRGARRPRVESPVALQIPDDYEGELTPEPSYMKAVLWSLLVGVIGMGAYAAVAWWRHREFGFIGWLIGVAIGITVVFASGRHFSWKLGLLAAGLSMFFISAGRILVYMLDVWFPSILKLPISHMDNFTHALGQYGRQFFTVSWLVFFLVTGLVAFLLSFRPWPLKLQPSESSTGRRVARKRA